MSDLQKALETTEATIEALQSYAENIRRRMMQPVGGVKKWSPVGGGFIDDEGFIFESPSTKFMKEFGHERPTQQQAERAVVEMRKFNRLLALRDELCGDDENYNRWLNTLPFKVTTGKWESITAYDYKFNTVYFSTKESAQRACEMLNSGEVEL